VLGTQDVSAELSWELWEWVLTKCREELTLHMVIDSKIRLRMRFKQAKDFVHAQSLNFPLVQLRREPLVP
jgi:hypothetical protein